VKEIILSILKTTKAPEEVFWYHAYLGDTITRHSGNKQTLTFGIMPT
jgi:hypothetical protein